MKIKIKINDKLFVSMAQAAKFLNISLSTLQTRRSKGWTILQALGIDSPPSHRAYNLWLKKQGINEKVCSSCYIQKPFSEYYGKTCSCKDCFKKKVRNNELLKKYNLTPKEYNQILKNQDYKCKICKTNDPKPSWAIDHNHKTGKVRGILCYNCNLLLAAAKENIEILKNAIIYLKGIRKNDDSYVDPEEIS